VPQPDDCPRSGQWQAQANVVRYARRTRRGSRARSSLAADDGVDEGFGLERGQVVGALTEPNQLDRDA
jgi:hypothetical protein